MDLLSELGPSPLKRITPCKWVWEEGDGAISYSIKIMSCSQSSRDCSIRDELRKKLPTTALGPCIKFSEGNNPEYSAPESDAVTPMAD